MIYTKDYVNFMFWLGKDFPYPPLHIDVVLDFSEWDSLYFGYWYCEVKK